jgi:single-stranded-DNA-specific exonuclease
MTETKHTSPKKRWVIAPPIPNDIKHALRDYPPLLRQLLFNRGINTAEGARTYLGTESPTSTDPFLMLGMREAVAVIEQALQADENITIYGDYDTDGVTAASLLFEFFSQIRHEPRVYIPNRFDEGYGLNMDAVELLAAEGTQLLITVDCGIRSLQEVQRAKELGMRVIITDHHQPGDQLPQADAVINPHQPADPYPYKELAGVGLAYKMVEAWLQTHPDPEVDLNQWLDLVAIGTVVDVAPLTGENRSLVKRGLERMRQPKRQGLFSLAQVASINPAKFNAGHLGFVIGPRLNAAGRIESALDAFRLLTSRDIFEAGWLAQQLDSLNSSRKEITNKIVESCMLNIAAQDPDMPVLFSSSSEYNAGVVGLAAGRLTEAYYKPAIIGSVEGDLIKASCRSIPEFDINHALDQCTDLLVRHGGHPMAAGLTVRTENAQAFQERLMDIARESFIGLDLTPALHIDYEIAIEKLQAEHFPGILEAVEQLEPTGASNPSALFCSRNIRVLRANTVGKGEHLKLVLGAGSNQLDAIAFRQGSLLETLPDYVDIAYTFEINEFNGRSTMQLNVRDIQPAAS